ncbi:hypothetical protein BGZ54_000338 [Gamsiella multidivaricata]|nr:hypothetical protein BGZ54_000338 [Gamsiella multidivaricata]
MVMTKNTAEIFFCKLVAAEGFVAVVAVGADVIMDMVLVTEDMVIDMVMFVEGTATEEDGAIVPLVMTGPGATEGLPLGMVIEPEGGEAVGMETEAEDMLQLFFDG